MNKKWLIVFSVGVALGVFFLIGKRTVKMSGYPLKVTDVKILQDGRIREYKVVNGQIGVLITDRYGDSHWHILTLEGVSQKEALRILAKKKSELEAKQK